MPKQISQSLIVATSDAERQSICQSWLNYTKIVDELKLTEVTNVHISILQQFTDLNCDFAKKHEFTERKMSCFMEIMHYMMKQLIMHSLDEEDSFAMFKELLLRHAIQRPPHSLAIFNLEDVKKIDLFALDTFYRHYSMYAYALTLQNMLALKSVQMFSHVEPDTPRLHAAEEMAPRDIASI